MGCGGSNEPPIRRRVEQRGPPCSARSPHDNGYIASASSNGVFLFDDDMVSVSSTASGS